VSATSQPRAASSRQIAAPRPPLPPVTTATPVWSAKSWGSDGEMAAIYQPSGCVHRDLNGRSEAAAVPSPTLACRECAVTSEAFHTGFGRYTGVFVGETHGWRRDEDGAEVTPDDIAAHLDEIRDRSEYAVPSSTFDEVRSIAEVLWIE
jgi:hypothetical protein